MVGRNGNVLENMRRWYRGSTSAETLREETLSRRYQIANRDLDWKRASSLYDAAKSHKELDTGKVAISLLCFLFYYRKVCPQSSTETEDTEMKDRQLTDFLEARQAESTALATSSQSGNDITEISELMHSDHL